MMTFICFVIAIMLSLWIINKGIEPTLMDIAEHLTAQMAREAINEAVSQQIVDDLEFDDLIQLERDNDGNIVSVGWNAVVINRVLRNTTHRVQNYLKQMGRGERSTDIDDEDVSHSEAVVRIPIGQATGNTLLANLGPRVPVHFTVIGDVQTDFITNIEEYGINSVVVELLIEVETNVQIVIPFSTSTTTVTTTVMVDVRTISGKVPEFYSSGQQNPSISIPYSNFIDGEDEESNLQH